MKIDDTAINVVPMLRDLRVTLVSSLSFNQDVINTCRSAYFELRRISLIRKYLIMDAAKQLSVFYCKDINTRLL